MTHSSEKEAKDSISVTDGASTEINNETNNSQTVKNIPLANQRKKIRNMVSLYTSFAAKKPERESHKNVNREVKTKISGKVVADGTDQVENKLCQAHTEVTGLVLIMIVKNESRIITRCLNSAQKIISGICITDTGSTDNCIEVIKQWAAEHDLPCEVPVKLYTPKTFKFSTARTVSFENGQKYFPNAKYYITIDADMELVVKDSWDLNKLHHGYYLVYQQTPAKRYPNTRLLRGNGMFKCLTGTHEFWRGRYIDPVGKKMIDLSSATCHDLEIIDRNDGGCKGNKYERDRWILESEIRDPHTAEEIRTRCKFYLAQTYMGMGLDQKAADMYEARFDAGGWYEERWYSLFSIGQCYESLMEKAASDDKSLEKLEYEEKAIAAYYRAYNYRNCRAETMCALASLYRKKGWNRPAFMCALEAQKIGYPRDDRLFIEMAVYDYRINFELSVAGYYLPDGKNIAAQAHRQLMTILPKLPQHIQSIVKGNNQFYKF